jgi:hypothetical protein
MTRRCYCGRVDICQNAQVVQTWLQLFTPPRSRIASLIANQRERSTVLVLGDPGSVTGECAPTMARKWPRR